MSDQACGLCGETNPDSFRIYFDGYIKLFRCLKCGFVAQFAGPGKNMILTDYEDCYSLDFVEQGREVQYPENTMSQTDMANRLAAIKPNGKCLDIGCGDGQFIQLCRERGMDCYGVEDSKVLADYAASKTGAKITQGLYNSSMFEAGSFDAISLVQVLEHIPTPVSALQTANYHLNQNGVILIEVPSIRSPHFLAYRLTRMKKFVRPPVGVLTTHCGYYAPDTLAKLADKCGFSPIAIVTGRWQHKYHGKLRTLGKLIDPILNRLRIGGILYIGRKERAVEITG